MLLAGKKVVVVGGSSGIGLSTAELAKSEGAEIWVASRARRYILRAFVVLPHRIELWTSPLPRH